eukprot:NODE_36_length_36011_cov_1.012920.p29 type:complete len:103 gc:universal NODE_36_length_36011_cov_1.012920:18998-19306(+)
MDQLTDLKYCGNARDSYLKYYSMTKSSDTMIHSRFHCFRGFHCYFHWELPQAVQRDTEIENDSRFLGWAMEERIHLSFSMSLFCLVKNFDEYYFSLVVFDRL